MSTQVIGHTSQRQQLQKLWRRKSLPSALLFLGAAGIGKELVARELFSSMLCEEVDSYGGCGACPSCKLLQHGTHPDLHTIDCGNKEDWGSAEFRHFLSRLHLKPFNGRSRGVILRDIHLLAVTSLNALLKTLEEPRPGTHFVLITSSPSSLPATIPSRCQRWYFHELAGEEIREILSGNPELEELVGEQDLTREELVQISEGTIGGLKQRLSLKPLFEKVLGDLKAIIEEQDGIKATLLAREAGKSREALKEYLFVIRSVARSEMRSAKSISDKKRWALLLQQALDVEYFSGTRNLNATYLFQLVFSGLLVEPFTDGGRDDTFHQSTLTERFIT